jgi:hypothetical protein
MSIVGEERLLERIRAEFLEMPGLKLTLAQARKIFGLKTDETKELLNSLTEEGFLVRDTRGAYRRRDVSVVPPNQLLRDRRASRMGHQTGEPSHVGTAG